MNLFQNAMEREGGITVHTIYLDILYCINLFVTYLLLLSTRALAQSKVSHTRIVFASLIGAAYSFIIVLPPLPVVLLAAGKLLLSALLVWIAFSKVRFGKHLLLFYLVNFLYAGLIEAAMRFFTLPGLVFQNGVIYFQLSAVRLCLLTVIAYGVLQLFSLVLFRTTPSKQLTQCKLELQGKSVAVTALIDTGNLTRDVISGLPVVILERDALQAMFSPETLGKITSLALDKLEENEQKLFHVIPMKGVGGSTLLVGFQPDRCELEQNGSWKSCDAVVAITKENLSNGDFHAIVPAKLIN